MLIVFELSVVTILIQESFLRTGKLPIVENSNAGWN